MAFAAAAGEASSDSATASKARSGSVSRWSARGPDREALQRDELQRRHRAEPQRELR